MKIRHEFSKNSGLFDGFMLYGEIVYNVKNIYKSFFFCFGKRLYGLIELVLSVSRKTKTNNVMVCVDDKCWQDNYKFNVQIFN